MERTEGGWTERRLGPGGQLVLTEPALTVAVDALYAGVTLEPR